MTLTLYIDFKCPASRLAVRPTLALIDRVGAALVWRPFRSEERDTPSVGADPGVIAAHQRARAASRRALFSKYAALQGAPLRFPERHIETDLALGVLTEIEGDARSFVRAAFAAYWRDNADLDDAGVVSTLIAESATRHSGELATAREALAAAQAKAEEAGVVDAPAYVVGDEIFIGREHLPWIEELLRSDE